MVNSYAIPKILKPRTGRPPNHQRYLGEAYITLNGKRNKAIADQIRTVSKLRLNNQFGHLSDRDMQRVERAVRIQFGLV